MGLPDTYTALQFDLAVGWFGTYIEGKLNELDETTGKPLHTLKNLLADHDDPKVKADKWNTLAQGLLPFTG